MPDADGDHTPPTLVLPNDDVKGGWRSSDASSESQTDEAETPKRFKSKVTKRASSPPKQSIRPVKSNCCRNMVCLLGVIGAVVACLAMSTTALDMICSNWTLSVCDDAARERAEMREFFTGEYRQLQAKYAAQPRRSWNTLGSSIQQVFRKDPPRPSVLLLISTPGSESTSRCLARDLAVVVAAAFQEPPPSPIFSSGLSGVKLDSQLKMSLDTGHVAIIYGIHRLNRDAALLLHGYCNDDDAPFRRSVLIFTASADSVSEPVDPDQLAEDILNSAWSIEEDKKGALVARVAVNVIVVTEGDDC